MAALLQHKTSRRKMHSITSRTLYVNMCSNSKKIGMLCTYSIIAVITVVCWISNNIYSY